MAAIQNFMPKAQIISMISPLISPSVISNRRLLPTETTRQTLKYDYQQTFSQLLKPPMHFKDAFHSIYCPWESWKQSECAYEARRDRGGTMRTKMRRQERQRKIKQIQERKINQTQTVYHVPSGI